MVGAGGGFLVVPALVLLGGLSMPVAIGTSLVVIALKSFAGFLGYVGHVAIDWPLAAGVTAAAVAGSVLGGRLAGRLSPAALRSAFAWLVLTMAVFILGQQIPDSARAAPVFRAIFVDRWPFWIGGAALSAFVLLFLWSENKLLGVSTGCAELCAVRTDPAVRRSWRLRFLGGIALGGVAASALAGASPTFAHGAFDTIFSSSLLVKAPILAGAGVLVGYGARAAGGCTSGHSMVGTALGARSSIVATALFLVAGFATTYLITLAGGVS
jgi:hypothetical protein